MSKAREYAICALAGVGAVTSLCAVVRGLSFIRTNYLTSCNMKRKYGKAGSWAVVTGASEGIGHAMALDLGRRGFNVCVIARTQSKLDAVVDELRALGVEGLAVSFDFGAATAKDWSDLFAKLDKLEIAVLVNNVGMMYKTKYTVEVESVSEEVDNHMLRVNCESTVRMTKYVVPKMKDKRCGAIVCLSSFSALVPTPLMATYAASKAFVLSFGTALHYELRPFGVDVLTVTPNVVRSSLTAAYLDEALVTKILTGTPEATAAGALSHCGSTARTAGSRLHVIVEALAGCLPTPVAALVTSDFLYSLHKLQTSRETAAR